MTSRVVGSVVSLLVLLWATPGHAVFDLAHTGSTTLSAPPRSECTSKKLEIAGKKLRDEMNCHSKAVNKGEPLDGECLSKVETKFSETWAKEEGKGGCLTTGDAAGIEGTIDGFIGEVVGDLVRAHTKSKCTSKKLGLIGKKAQSLAKCHAKALDKGLVVDEECLQKASDTFAKGWPKAEKEADCQAGPGDLAHIEGEVDELVEGLVDLLVP